MKYIFDTNAVINFVCDTGDFLRLSGNDQFFISFITLIELSVGFKTSEEEKITKLFINKSNIILIDNELINSTIEIRKTYGLKLPDSIIVATALRENAILITSDSQILKKTPAMSIQIFNPLQTG